MIDNYFIDVNILISLHLIRYKNTLCNLFIADLIPSSGGQGERIG